MVSITCLSGMHLVLPALSVGLRRSRLQQRGQIIILLGSWNANVVPVILDFFHLKKMVVNGKSHICRLQHLDSPQHTQENVYPQKLQQAFNREPTRNNQ